MRYFMGASTASGLIAILLLAACTAAPTNRPSSPTTTSESESEALLELQEAELRWGKGVDAYTLRVEHSAMVSNMGCRVQSFEVSRGRVRPIGERGCSVLEHRFGSVPALFQLARDLLAEHRGAVTAEFDPMYGYPRKFQVWRPGIEDSHFGFEVEFAIVPGAAAP